MGGVIKLRDVVATIRHLDLCSGLGLFSLGLQLADPRIRTVGFVERQAYCAAVLLARMEDEALARAPVFCGELQDVDGSELCGQVDLITAGYPCQPWSAAGSRKGVEDDRWIWPAIRDLIAEVEPSAVMLENVTADALCPARSDLLGMGFDVRPGDGPLRVAAEDVGAPHRRARFFLLAHRGGFGCNARKAGAGWEAGDWPDGLREAVADTNGERTRSEEQRRRLGLTIPSGENVADSVRSGCGGNTQRQREEEQREALGRTREDVGKPLADADRAGREEQRRGGLLDGQRATCGHDADRQGMPFPPGPDGDWSGFPAETQPGFPGASDGNAARVEQIHALGNGVLPQVVAAAWRCLTRVP